MWKIEADFDRDNTFAYDLTTHVIRFKCGLGMREAYQLLADESTLALTVQNSDGRFNPENASGPYYGKLTPHTRIRITAERDYADYDALVTSGLMAYLKLGEFSGTIAEDGSPENNDGSYANVTLNAADSNVPGDRTPFFNGTNSVVNLYSAGFTSDFDPEEGSLVILGRVSSSAVWVDGEFRDLVRIAADDSNFVRIVKTDFDHNVVLDYCAGGTLKRVALEGLTITDDFCFTLTWSKSADRVRAYYNGVQVGGNLSGLGTWAGTLGSTLCAIGATTTAGPFYWSGYLSHCRIYNREITPSEAASLAGNGNEILWIGWLRRILPDQQPAGSQTGKTLAQLHCVGAKMLLDAVTVDVGVYSNVTGDQVVADVLQKAVIPPALAGAWLAEIPGSSEAGITTFAGTPWAYSNLETGRTEFQTLLHDRKSNVKGFDAIRLVTEGERGHFFFDRAGKAIWWNRHHLLNTISSIATVDLTGSYKPVDVDYQHSADNIKNIVRVMVVQRSTTTSQTLWSLKHPISIPPNSTIRFDAVLRDTDGDAVGAQSLSTANVIFSAGSATITLEATGSRAKVTITNSSSTAATLTALDITGTPIQDRNRMVGMASDADSIGQYGRRELDMTLRALETLEQAESVAQFELLRHKTARGQIASLDFLNAADDVTNAHQLDWTIGTRLTITLSNGHSTDYFIIGEQHEVTLPGLNSIHRTRFFLEPALAGQFWLAGMADYSEAGQTTYGGY